MNVTFQTSSPSSSGESVGSIEGDGDGGRCSFGLACGRGCPKGPERPTADGYSLLASSPARSPRMGTKYELSREICQKLVEILRRLQNDSLRSWASLGDLARASDRDERTSVPGPRGLAAKLTSSRQQRSDGWFRSAYDTLTKQIMVPTWMANHQP